MRRIKAGFIPDLSIDISELMRRESSYDSMIHMKEINSDIHTGKEFRKCSTFMITPTASTGTHSNEIADGQLTIKVMENSGLPQLFIEFDCLKVNPITKVYCWMEKSRWLRYEEEYDHELKRFDNPHLSAISARGLTGFRKFFKKGESILNCQSEKYNDVLKALSDRIIESDDCTMQEIKDLQILLTLKHYHAGEEMKSSPSDMPSFKYNYENQCLEVDDVPQITNKRLNSISMFEGSSRKSNRTRMDEKLHPNTEALSVQVGALETFRHVYSLFVRLDPPIKAIGLNEVNCPIRFIYILFGPKNMEKELLEVGRAFSTMMSNPEFREVAYAAETKDEILEATTNFLQHSVIVPLTKEITNDALVAMLPQLQHYANYFRSEQNKKTLDDIRKEIHGKNHDVFQKSCSSEANGEYPSFARDSHISNLTFDCGQTYSEETVKVRSFEKMKRCCLQFHPPFHQFLLDCKGLKKRYLSDFKDAFIPEHLSIIFTEMIFLYVSILSPALAFGAFYMLITEKLSVSICILSSGVFQLLYTLISGQPLGIVGITAPLYLIERTINALSRYYLIELDIIRFWVGVYVSLHGILFIMFNGVICIKHIRRSVEDIYCVVEGIILIFSALFTIWKIFPHLHSITNENGTTTPSIQMDKYTLVHGGMTLFLAFLMFNFCLFLANLERRSIFHRQIRKLLRSLNIPLGILLVVVVEKIFFQRFLMPTLIVSTCSQSNNSCWFNPPEFLSITNVSLKTHLYSYAISISLFLILVFQTSSNLISIAKVERKLQKESLFSLNYLSILVFFPLISGFFGWPFVSGAIIRSNAHCNAMAKWNLNNPPGVSPKVTGTAEQRVSGIVASVLVLISVSLGFVFQHIPVAALYGQFIFMGLVSIQDLVFTKRLISIFLSRNQWSLQNCVKDYPIWNVLILVFIQGLFVLLISIVNFIFEFSNYVWTPLLFPLLIACNAFVREFLLPLWPRLNTHLSKMDRKHQVNLYGSKKPLEQIIIITDEHGRNRTAVPFDINEGRFSI